MAAYLSLSYSFIRKHDETGILFQQVRCCVTNSSELIRWFDPLTRRMKIWTISYNFMKLKTIHMLKFVYVLFHQIFWPCCSWRRTVAVFYVGNLLLVLCYSSLYGIACQVVSFVCLRRRVKPLILILINRVLFAFRFALAIRRARLLR